MSTRNASVTAMMVEISKLNTVSGSENEVYYTYKISNTHIEYAKYKNIKIPIKYERSACIISLYV